MPFSISAVNIGVGKTFVLSQEMRTESCYQIGEWRYWPRTGELQRDTRQIRLEPRVADVLTLLMLRVGNVVSRDELLKRCWPHNFVVEESVTRCVSEIRKIFGDDRPYRYIETLPKRGYRLIAPVGSCGTDAAELRCKSWVSTSSCTSRHRSE